MAIILNDGEYQVLGIQKRISKVGHVDYYLYLMTTFSAYEREHFELCGYRVLGKYVSNIGDAQVGDVVKLIFGENYHGKAYVKSLEVLSQPVKS